jgi:biopolymer transport protein TolR
MRRLRDQNEELEDEAGELNLVPYMDIVTNIIIFLLATVEYNVSLGHVNVAAPTLSSGGGAAAEEPERPPLNLTVTAATNGFIIAASGGALPLIPKTDKREYDYQALTDQLLKVKAEEGNQSETKATFSADADIPYEIVVKTLDAMREDTKGKALFPDIVFAAGIL